MSHLVFLSYRRDDAQGHARALNEFLEQRFAPGTVFFDRDRGAIDEGQDFQQRITSALGQAEVVLALIGKAWVDARDAQGRLRLQLLDDVVRQELELALQSDKLVVSVLFDGAMLPSGDQLPTSLQGLARRDAFMLVGKTDEFQHSRERLARFIEQQPGLRQASARHQLKLPHERQLLQIQRHYLGRDEQLPAFVGREGQLHELDAWLDDASAPARLLLTGAAAMGKSSLILHWLQDPTAQKSGWEVVYLPVSVRFGTNTPDLFWSMAAARLAKLAGITVEAPSARLADVYLDVCLDALDRLDEQGRRLLFVLDGLDELAGWDIDRRLLAAVPLHGRWLVSARAAGTDAHAAGRWLQTLGWRRDRSTKILELVALDRDTVVQAVRHCLPDAGDSESVQALGEDVWRASAGDPMLLGYYLDDLATLPQATVASASQALAKIEPGFASYFNHWVTLQRPYWNDEAGRSELLDGLLVLLCCAQGPLPIDGIEHLLSLAFGLNAPLTAVRLRGLQRFVIAAPDGLVLAHPRLRDHLLQEFPEDGRWVQRARQAFLEWGRHNGPDTVGERYLARYHALHLAEAHSKAQPGDFLRLATVAWVQLSLRQDDSGRQLALDLEIARAALLTRAGAGEPLQGWLWALMLMRASIQTRARVKPELLAAFAQHGLLSREHALRRLELMPTRDRACGLVLLANELPAAEPERLLVLALQAVPAIADFTEKMALWAAALGALPVGPARKRGEAALLQALGEARTMYEWLEAVDVIAPSLTLDGQVTLLHWCFAQVDSNEDWDRLDALLPHLQPPLHDQAVALAIQLGGRLDPYGTGCHGQPGSAAHARLAHIPNAALHVVFTCLTPQERDTCWQRLHSWTQLAQRETTQIDGLRQVWPWLRAHGRETEVRTQLQAFYTEYSNEYAKAEILVCFARACAGSDMAAFARELLVATLLRMPPGDSLQVKYLARAADVLDDASVARCFDHLVMSGAPGRWRAVAQFALRLSTPQLVQVRSLQRQLGDQRDAGRALCSLRLQQGATVDTPGWLQDLAALRQVDPEATHMALLRQADPQRWDEVFGPHLLPLAGNDDALLIARPGDATPQALWAAIQRQESPRGRAFAMLEHHLQLGGIRPDDAWREALDVLIDAGHFREILDALATGSDLPTDMAAALQARMGNTIRRARNDLLKHFRNACLLAVAGPLAERASWKIWVLDTLREELKDDPEPWVAALPLCDASERGQQLSKILDMCGEAGGRGLSALLLLAPQLRADEGRPFVACWLSALRNKCSDEPEWLSTHDIPTLFQPATLNSLEELLARADRGTLMRTLVHQAPVIAAHLGPHGLEVLVSGVRTAADGFA